MTIECKHDNATAYYLIGSFDIHGYICNDCGSSFDAISEAFKRIKAERELEAARSQKAREILGTPHIFCYPNGAIIEEGGKVLREATVIE